jgi:hypothetical protein
LTIVIWITFFLLNRQSSPSDFSLVDCSGKSFPQRHHLILEILHGAFLIHRSQQMTMASVSADLPALISSLPSHRRV